MRRIDIRTVSEADLERCRELLVSAWGSTLVARKGELVDASALPAFLAEVDGAPVGICAVAHRGEEYEVVALSTQVEGRGVGRRLMEAAVADARSRGCRRLWLTTTNNNVRALDFYQRFGMDLCAFHRDGVSASRRLKPSIPLVDARGLPIAHELELELLL